MTDSTSTEPQTSPGEPGEPKAPPKAPSKNVVLLFCGSIVISVLLFVGASSYAIWHGNHTIYANNQDWCTALKILTKTPVAYPADPAKNPSRVFAYNLYTSFRDIEGKFGC